MKHDQNIYRQPNQKGMHMSSFRALRSIVQTGAAMSFLVLLSFSNPAQKAYAANTSCPLGTTLNIVAHEDDDLLFLNPDIQHDISSGRCVITTYLTAGDANQGTSYWIGRENGEKVAYALMNSGMNFWTLEDAGISGHPIPVFTMAGSPNTSLAFIRLPDGNYDGTGFSNNNFESLQKLWQGNIPSMTTVDQTSTYAKQDVINTLLALMNKFQPDIIRTQNFVDQYDSSVDHSDHYSTAYMTKAASQLYGLSHMLISYDDYEINSLPQNVFGSDASAKQDTFINYAQSDPLVCQTVSACSGTKYAGWFVREYTAAMITPIPTPTATPTGEPTPTPTQSPVTNIAPQGTGYRWSQMTSSSLNTNKIASPGINDTNTSVDVPLNGGPDDISNAYEGAGVIFSTGQNNVTRISFINGSWEASQNGAFVKNLQLQTSFDGSTWSDSGLSPMPVYDYDSLASGGKTYVFDGALPANVMGIRITGQVHTSGSLSWYANIRELRIETGTVTATPTPTPTVSSPPSPTPTGAPLSNIAPIGTGYRWSQMNLVSSDTNRVAAPGINDSDTSTNVVLNGGPDDNANAYEAAGVVWTNAQNGITKVEYLNGSWEASQNGAFTANMQLQTTADGTTWTNSGLTPTPSYDYDNPAASGKTYVFTGSLPNNIVGVRVAGQVRTPSAKSWYANTWELLVETGSFSVTPTPTPTGGPRPTPTTIPTPTPLPGGSLISSTWTLSGINGASEEDHGINAAVANGKTSVTVSYDLHGASFGSGDDEASVIFIQNNTWYAVNIIGYGTNGKSGTQTITVPLSAFHAIGNQGALLDTTKSISDVHARFWNQNTFTVDIFNITIQ